MSENESWTGKIRFLCNKEEAEAMAKSLLPDDYVFEYEDNTAIDELMHEYTTDEYVTIKGSLYKIVELAEGADNAVRNGDGTISFGVTFYNGGCGLEEAIEYVVEGYLGDE